jgi:uncharacterized spore protein YtfJ
METEVRTALGTPSDMRTFIERMAEKIGVTANARAVYGEPIERYGTTVIPVAKVRYGFGGGAGQKQQEEGGAGGGGGVQVWPLGYIELGPHAVKFRRIRATSPVLPLALGLFGVWMLARTLAR